MELRNTRSEIEEFLDKNKRKLDYMESLFSVDDNRDEADEFTDDKLKVLCVFLTPASSRAVSNTFNALMSLVKKEDPENIMVDSCYYPEEANLEVFDSNKIPYVFGSACHEPMEFYDLVLMSNAVCPEVLNIPKALYKSGIGLTIEEREKQKTPMIFFGGAAANETSIVLGPINRDGKCIGKSLIDIAEYGYGEKVLPTLGATFLKYKRDGVDLKDKAALREKLITDKVLIEYLFHPNKYEWVYDKKDNFTIKKIKKLDKRLPNMVKYARIRINEDMGWTTKVFNLSGDNADSHDIMISSGCSGGSSNCSFSFAKGTTLFTSKGILPIEEVFAKATVIGSPEENVRRGELDIDVQAVSGVEKSHLVYSVGTKPILGLKTRLGYMLPVTRDHKCLVGRIVIESIPVEGSTEEEPKFKDVERFMSVSVPAEEVSVGDKVFLGTSNVFGPCKKGVEAERIGKIVGKVMSCDMTLSKDEKSFYETSIRTEAQKLGIPSQEHYVTIPEEVRTYDEESLRAFLRGLIDVSGVSPVGCSDVYIRTKTVDNGELLKTLLLSVGIFTESVGTEDGVDLYVVSKYSKNELLSLSLRNEDLVRRIKEILKVDESTLNVQPIQTGTTEFIDKNYRFVTDEIIGVFDLGIQEIYDITVEPTHTVVANGFVVNQCMEATVAGGYREKPLEQVEELMKDTKRICASNTISYYSYNLNYYYRFMDLLATGAKYFSGVTLLNERLDVVAHAPEQLKLAKKLGLKRFSGAIEGMGPRIRDGLLNKNLDKETLEQANHVIASLGLMHFKAGLIATGQETDDDIDAFVAEIDRMIAIRDEHGANHSFQFNVTPLVFYSQIALRHFPRITAENSYNSVRNMGRFIDACKQRGIRAKFNGKGCGTWLEQLLLDFGPAGTDWMVGLTIDQGLGYIRFFGDKIKTAACEELDKRGYDHLFFTKARPKDWIFPNDHIDSIPQELKDMWWERTEAWLNGDNSAFDSKLCLRTPANLDGAKCYGCKMCESAEEIKQMVKREIYDEHSYEQVAEMLSDSRHQKSVRVVIKMKPKWFFYNCTALAHYVTSKFLQASDEICDAFYSVGKTTTTWIANNGQKAWVGGTKCFDINLRERVSIQEFERVIPEINEKLKSCQILRVIDDTKVIAVKRETNISYIGQTSAYSLSQIKDKLSMFNWDVKVAVKSMGGGLETELKHMPELKNNILFVQNGNSVLIGMDLPASVSPFFVMNSIMGKSYEKALDDFAFDVIDQTKDTDTVDSKGQHIGYSYFTGSYNKRANIETIRLYLAKLTGKVK